MQTSMWREIGTIYRHRDKPMGAEFRIIAGGAKSKSTLDRSRVSPEIWFSEIVFLVSGKGWSYFTRETAAEA